MQVYIRGILFVCFITTSSVFYNLTSKGAEDPAATSSRAFFESNSSVNDFYYGDISTPFSTVINSDISLVMYYAPWDFDSQLTKSALEKIAQKYKGQVKDN